ncbi:MAG: hypothetical protein R3348_03235 [Xanthomonadales bacterium]|nr:hypothetical protein [Xanthomonadales bacterium]
MTKIFWGDSPIKPFVEGTQSGIVRHDGEAYYKIANYEQMPPFFMTLVSGFDHWMFLSSTGGLTCGRRNPDSALFPYYTDDKIHDAGSTTGSRTVLLVNGSERHYLWEPFERGPSAYKLERNLYKNLSGTRLVFEEINHDLGLAYDCGWSTSDRFGFIKESVLRNLGEDRREVDVLDGLRNLLPYGVTQRVQETQSTLLDGYKQAEHVPDLAAAIYTLSSILTDRAEPCEALRASVAWSTGLDDVQVLLSEDQVDAFRYGKGVAPEALSRGKRCAFYIQSSLALGPGQERRWHIAADVNQGPSRLPALLREIRQGVAAEAIEEDIAAGTRRLVQLVGGADGCQLTSDTLVTARHFSNTLFNIMRGGTFHVGYQVPGKDFLEFVRTWNAPLHTAFARLLDQQDRPLTIESLTAAADDDADMERLALEYLPLTFSRRHGDPSRPWNRFSIDIRNPDGSEKLSFQGNWRDIFQNWEALSLSYPGYIESFIAKFVNASTADGYNPYRITREGIDWEVLEEEDSWSNIGYWGDHQVNYLLKLLELSRKYHPGKLETYLDKEIFVYANVPYRIKDYAALVADPRDTVTYDYEEEAAIERRVAALGGDGKLAVLPDGSICRVNLLEKLLLPALVKLGNFVPGGGIWMNTQRPEWNDANNALVGYGLSMVTLCYLRRYLRLLSSVLAGHGEKDYPVSSEVLALFEAIETVLRDHEPSGGAACTPEQRKVVMDELGAASQAHRERVYAGLSGEKSRLASSDILKFIDLAIVHIDHSIAGNRRPDGLYHSYNLVHFGTEGYALETLYEMLEGQVAVLSSGFLGPGDSLELLESLRASPLYRADQNSYMLYPDKEQARFLEKNVIPKSMLEGNEWVARELQSGRKAFIEQDADGAVHFNPDLRNGARLAEALERHPDVSAEDAAALCDLYESVFKHRRFTGRSGSMFKYEGLGSIYWHMVSKLLLATAEVIETAGRGCADEPVLTGLLNRFDDIKEGLGVHKPPAEYGAFPIDPYSHTPGFIGVQQPGMTGQVKEDVITRFTELGVHVKDGCVAFEPGMLRRGEFLTEPRTWVYDTGESGPCEETLPAGSLAFSVCGVPVIYRLAESEGIEVHTSDGEAHGASGNQVGKDWCQSLFRRDGRVQKIIVDVPASALR